MLEKLVLVRFILFEFNDCRLNVIWQAKNALYHGCGRAWLLNASIVNNKSLMRRIWLVWVGHCFCCFRLFPDVENCDTERKQEKYHTGNGNTAPNHFILDGNSLSKIWWIFFFLWVGDSRLWQGFFLVSGRCLTELARCSFEGRLTWTFLESYIKYNNKSVSPFSQLYKK